VFLIALSAGGMGTVSFMSGNLTVFLHFAILSTLLMTMRREWGSGRFLAAVCAAAIVKPYFLALVPLALLFGAVRRELAKAVLAVFVVAAVYAAYLLCKPDEMQAFRIALNTQILVRGDYGSSVAAIVSRYGGGAISIASAFVLVLLLVGTWAAWLWRRLPTDARRSPVLVFAGYAALTLINPRAHLYDLFHALFCLVAIVDRFGWPLRSLVALLAASIAGYLPSFIAEFAREPGRYPSALLNYTVAQHVVLGCALAAAALAPPRLLADAEAFEDVTKKIV
jgi:hypothetical protein